MQNKVRETKNIEIIKLLKNGVVSDDLRGYTGWGGLRDSIYNRDVYRQLKMVMTDAEIQNIKETLSSAYYTPRIMIQSIYAILDDLGFTGGRVLEPAAGHGAFIECMPVNMRKASHITAVEIETFSVQILKALYSEITVEDKGFETYDFKPEFDLVIGNPPYGSKSITDLFHTDLNGYAIHHQFLAKGFRLLKENGILAMVLPSFCLDNQSSHVRTLIHNEGGRLIKAYRMPDSLFADAKVTVDLVFIIKDRSYNQTKWVETKKVTIDGYNLSMNEYFIDNPGHILGELKVIDAYGRKLLTCKGCENAYQLLEEKLIPKYEADYSPANLSATKYFEQMINEYDQQIELLQVKKERLINCKFELMNLKI